MLLHRTQRFLCTFQLISTYRINISRIRSGIVQQIQAICLNFEVTIMTFVGSSAWPPIAQTQFRMTLGIVPESTRTHRQPTNGDKFLFVWAAVSICTQMKKHEQKKMKNKLKWGENGRKVSFELIEKSNNEELLKRRRKLSWNYCLTMFDEQSERQIRHILNAHAQLSRTTYPHNAYVLYLWGSRFFLAFRRM